MPLGAICLGASIDICLQCNWKLHCSKALGFIMKIMAESLQALSLFHLNVCGNKFLAHLEMFSAHYLFVNKSNWDA